jgi:hypothetical protein
MAIVFSAKITGQINADDIFSKGNYYTGAVCRSAPPPSSHAVRSASSAAGLISNRFP